MQTMQITQSTANTLSSLLSDLEEYYPNQIPINSRPTLEDFRRLQGQQEVIQYIRNLIEPDDTGEGI
jgi:hypothetical protein